ncbi:serine/threonine-protein kinase [Noviherbaspirillum sedimenti]|uniref:Protein kinase domain-containing protein n=1 Tax=Noviherbaspirillum sedimenti TaxID=2320865 RepID=A0A3A3FW24_9BURK|nr:serine/threonine-protein kinase [Noviherbaspirillum sedimenti]RJG00398.1 hypothetical protein D3878_01395 [Noviherbaspirillum sedimenti]
MMNLKHDSAQTAMRTRRLMFKPTPQGDADYGANVLPVGTHLGEFEILDLIGEGGFGIVYLAYDHSLERQVALKEYMPSGLATRTTRMAVSVRSQKKLDTFTAGLKSFINEAKMLAQFDSPALVKVHSFWEGNGTAYMVMPYYEGMTLKQALQTHKIKPTEAWLRMLLADLFDAIEILHRAHCLHRDIAPDNILLLKDGRPLLLDFGAARRVIGDLTQCFTAILKPGFAPIEQYADIAGLRQGAWTDVYALAAVVYYLITGKAPPPAVARMVHDELVPAREAGKGRYSEAFLSSIDKALAVKPEQRFHSIDELRRALGISEPEPRTVPRPGSDWSTTVARTIPVAQVDGSQPDVPTAADPDITRHVGSPVRPPKDVTANVPPAPDIASRPAPADKPLHGGHDGTQYGKQYARPADNVDDKGGGKAAAPFAPPPEPRASSEPELLSVTQMAGDWHTPPTPPHRFEQDAIVSPRRDRQGWLVFALLFAAGIGSGIYLGANHSWDGLSEQALVADSGVAEPVAGSPPQPAGALPPSAAASASSASSGASEPSEAGGAAGTAAMPPQSPSADRPGSEIDMWQIASKRNQASAYESYLRQYPQGRYAAIARLRLERLQAATAAAELPRQEAPHAATASPVPVPAPASPPGASAAGKPEAKVAPAGTKPEEAAWSKASASNDVAAYQDYLRKYPKGGYAALARDRLASLKPAAPASAPTMMAKEQAQSTPAPVTSASTAGMVPAPASPPTSTPTVPVPSAAASTTAAASPAPVAATPMPPQAALKPEDATDAAPAESAGRPGRNAVKFDDQTMTGDFSVDKKSGLVSGKVKITWSNGNQFDGTLVQGSKEGKGKFVWSSGQRYTGDWANDMPNGKGTFIFSDGSRYDGEVREGMPHGYGSTRFKSGIVYTGDWVRGKSHGRGRYIWTDGSYWEGEFRDDKKTENGKMYFPNKGAAPAASTPPGEYANPGAASAATTDAGRKAEAR